MINKNGILKNVQITHRKVMGEEKEKNERSKRK
jgi:hypothetical protein